MFTKSSEESPKIRGSFTEQQERIPDYTTNRGLNRIIHYCSRGLGIELLYENDYKTHYFNTDCEEENLKEYCRNLLK